MTVPKPEGTLEAEASSVGPDELRELDPIGPSGLPREALLRIHARTSTPHSATSVWSEILTGACRLVDHFCTPTHCYAVLQSLGEHEASGKAIGGRDLEILRRLVRGGSQKAIALELGLSDACVALSLDRSRRAMGLCCRTSESPLSLILLAQAYWRVSQANGVRLSQPVHLGARFQVISLLRPDSRLGAQLPPGEMQVTRWYLEGRSTLEIARLRRASPRTVVNQLAAARQKFRVSGRLELVRVLSAPARERRAGVPPSF
jgi:DNA-binding CsgD family transcriptional regulator